MWQELFTCQRPYSSLLLWALLLSTYGPLSSCLPHWFLYKRVKGNLGYLLYLCFYQKWEMKYRLRKPCVFHSAGFAHLCYLPALKEFEFMVPGIEVFCEPFKVTSSSPDELISVNMMSFGTLSALCVLAEFYLSLYIFCLFSKPVVSKYRIKGNDFITDIWKTG